MTGDRLADVDYVGWHLRVPRFVAAQNLYLMQEDSCFEKTSGKNYDIPWCIDLFTGILQIPTLGMEFQFDEWVLL